MNVLMTKVVPVIGLLVQLLFITDVLIELYKKFKPKMKKTTNPESSIENKDEL